MVLVRGFIGSAVDSVVGSQTIKSISVRVNIGGVPGQGESAKWNFEGGAGVNGGRPRSRFFVRGKGEEFVAVGVATIVAFFAAKIGGASEGFCGEAIRA